MGIHPMNSICKIAIRSIPVAVISMVAMACAGKPRPDEPSKPYCQYTASGVGARPPGKIYFFPPLLCDNKGNPLEVLKPVVGKDGALLGWSAPSPLASRIESHLRKHAQQLNFEPVTFADVLASKDEHSILIVSSFYSKPQIVEHPEPGKADRYILTMMKASTFDLTLDPSKSRMVGKSDGLAFYHSSAPVPQIEAKSLAPLIKTLGDQVTGYSLVEQ